MGLNDRAADREAHAYAVRLRRVEKFKETRQALWAQPVAGIPHRDAHAIQIDAYAADVRSRLLSSLKFRSWLIQLWSPS